MGKVDNIVLGVLSSGEIDGNVFRLNCGQLERKVYIAVNKVLENIGGKWDRKLKGHVFDTDPTEKLEEVMLTGETVNEKQFYQFFETPKELAMRIIETADIGETMTVLEPSAGLGAIVKFIPATVSKILCCELDPQKADVLRKEGFCVQAGDFLEEMFEGVDRVVMNPPFTKQQDIDHVLKAYDCLRDGGRLVSVMSPGFTFRQNKKSVEFKKLVDKNRWWEELPDGTFKESGTLVRTVLVLLDKKG